MSNVNDVSNAAEMNHYIPQYFLDGLPDEMVIRMLLFCGYRDMLSFSATCKRYKSIVSNSVVLQLRIELEANGLQIARDIPVHTNGDHLSLLEKLRRYRDAWLDLDLRPPIQLQCGDEDMPLWELRDGAFVKSYDSSDAQPRSHKPNSLRLVPLSTNNASTQVNFGVSFGEFSLDTGQDLVVLAVEDYRID